MQRLFETRRQAGIATRTAIAALALSALSLQSCGTPTPTRRALELRERDQVMVTFRGVKQTMYLQNKSSTDLAKAYDGTTPALKVIPDEQMQFLLDAFATHGFFDRARDRLRDATKELTVKVNDQQWTLPWSPRDAGFGIDGPTFNACWAEFDTTFNQTMALHSATGTNYRELYRQRTRTNRDSADRYRSKKSGDGANGGTGGLRR